MEKTVVTFYMEELPPGVLAVFPYNQCKPGFVNCYSKEEQHTQASLEYCKGLRKATKSEYAALAKELEKQGYLLKVI